MHSFIESIAWSTHVLLKITAVHSENKTEPQLATLNYQKIEKEDGEGYDCGHKSIQRNNIKVHSHLPPDTYDEPKKIEHHELFFEHVARYI